MNTLDHSTACVRISLAGLSLSCINGEKQNRYEVGIIGCDRHQPVLDIQEITFDPKSKQRTRASLVNHQINMDDDILIEVGGTSPSGVSRYESPDFDRLNDKGDKEDFRWIIDLEGEVFNKQRLAFKPASNGSNTKLKPRIFVTAGTVYTEKKSDEILAILPLSGGVDLPLGKVGLRVGIDIDCPSDAGKVVISNVDVDEAGELTRKGTPKRLEKKVNTQYLITIENLCESSSDLEGTDFRLFFDVLRNHEYKTFDLIRVVKRGGYGDRGVVLSSNPNFSLDNPPENCLNAFVGQTNTIVRS